MKPLKTISDLRECFGISQQTLAEYLSTTRSQLSYVEAGGRYLEADGILFLSKLEACWAFINSQKPAPKTTALYNQEKLSSDKVTTYTYRVITCEKSIAEHRQTIAKMKEQGTLAQRWKQALTILKDDIPAGRRRKEQVKWMAGQEDIATQKINNCSVLAQQELQLKIDLLTAEAGVLNQYLARNQALNL